MSALTRTTIIAMTTLLGGCLHFTSVGPTTRSELPRAVTQDMRELAALALIARAGEALALEGPDANIDEILVGCIEKELSRQAVVSGKYELVWGPATFKFPNSVYDDNMMYIVQETADSSQLVIVIRGTNAIALRDWLKEDFAVREQVDWPYYQGQPPVPRLSKGTHVGLTVLENMSAHSDVSEEHLSVRDYLHERVRRGSLSRVMVVGHSLGGALAPALGLWLKDTADEWQGSTVGIAVTALAGATPGERVFAAYYNERLGAETDRLINPYDIVPLAWNTATMFTMPGLYQGAGIRPNALEKFLVSEAIRSVTGFDYQQIIDWSPSLEGAVMTTEGSFLRQAGWQHVCGYQCAIGIELETVSINCRDFPTQVACNCPGR